MKINQTRLVFQSMLYLSVIFFLTFNFQWGLVIVLEYHVSFAKDPKTVYETVDRRNV
jgi:hypothetical protein